MFLARKHLRAGGQLWQTDPRGAYYVTTDELMRLGPSRQCSATLKLRNQRCTRMAVVGSHVCALHGGSSPLAKALAKKRLMMLIEPAFEMLMRAMESNDMKSGVRAAEIILDRAGFGPQSTLRIEDERDNLANLSTDELQQRAERLAERARALALQKKEAEPPAQDGEIIQPFGDGSVH